MLEARHICARLRSHGLSPSAPRVAIYAWLVEHPVHPTVDTIYRALRPEMASLSRATVYNTLRAFVDCGLAIKVHSEDSELRYDGNPMPHAHFKCTACGTLVDLGALPKRTLITIGLPEDSEVQTVALTVWGRCPACSGKTQSHPA